MNRTLAFLLLCASEILTTVASADQGLVLFTSTEANQLRFARGEPWDPQIRTRSLKLGPEIVVRLPTVNEYDGRPTIQTLTPTNLEVSFHETQAAVDMSSLDVRAKKGFFSKSLTEMMKPYVHGRQLLVHNVEIPSGRFIIQIAIADVEGKKTMSSYRLIVDEKR